MKARHLRVIKEIQERIPKDLLDRLMKKEEANPASKKVLQEALLRPDDEVSPKKKRRIRALLDSGYLNQMVEVIDPEVEKEIDEFMTKEIELAVRLGRLPKEAPQLETLTKKGHQYARRQHARIKELFMGKDSDVAVPAQDTPEDQGEHSPRQDDGSILHAPSVTDGGQGGARQD